MLLSLRSNPQTMSPYIQDCDGLCTRTDHHMLLPILSSIKRASDEPRTEA